MKRISGGIIIPDLVLYYRAIVIKKPHCIATYIEKSYYGIEVKTRGGNPLSLKVFIDNHLIDKGIVAKPTPGGHGDRFDTIPIYAVGCRFPYR